MNIYLMQHGKPVPKEKNPDKPLSDRGRDDVMKMAGFLKKAGIQVETVFHSGKTRARQTAEIISSKINPGKESRKRQGLSPLDDVKTIAEEIKQGQKDFMIVGHLPHLGKLISLLITGSDSSQVVSFQQGGVLCLRTNEEEKNWAIAWMLVPEIIP
ncbi:MAG: phosphohistidine phosphatase SixA [Desulfobacteraceae bacterium]|nr:MAG: phosphohistidine phosphatase SixA [Desulfobacteraceae bacterium]